MQPFSLGPFKINLNDKLRSGFRVKYNLLVDKVIKAGKAVPKGITLITHDNSEIEIDLTEFFYSKEILDDLFFIDYATEEEAGKIRIATIEEVLAGEDDLTVVTPYKLAQMLFSFSGRAVIAGEDLAPGDFVYLELIEDEELPENPNPDDPENEEPTEPPFFPVLKAFKAIATSLKTCAVGFIEIEALAGEETFIRFSGNISTYGAGYVPGNYYYLSDGYAGLPSPYLPSEPGRCQQILGVAISELELMVEIHRPDLNWTPILLDDDVPALVFSVGNESTDSFKLTEYLQEYNIILKEEAVEEPLDPAEDLLPPEEPVIVTMYEYRFLGLPDWVTDHSVVFDEVIVTGAPTIPGVTKFFLEIIDVQKRRYLQQVRLQVLPPVKYEYTLLDMSSGSAVPIGSLPGVYELPEGKYDVDVRIRGRHDQVQISIFSGADSGLISPYTFGGKVEETDDAVYRIFGDTGGVITNAGQFRLFTSIFLRKRGFNEQDIMYTLYDEEFLSKASFSLVKNGAPIAEISPDGTTVFENPDGADVGFYLSDTPHTRVALTLNVKSDGELLKGNEYDVAPTDPEADHPIEGDFLVYETPSLTYVGVMTVEAVVYDTDEQGNEIEVLRRYADFEIKKKVPVAEGGKIELLARIDGTAGWSTVAVLPKTGSEHAFLPKGFNLRASGETAPFNEERVTYRVSRGGVMSTVEISRYTRLPQVRTYAYPVTESDWLIFDTKTSLEIDSINEEDTVHSIVIDRFLNGVLVAVLQADFSFGPFKAPEDFKNEDDVAGLIDYVGRAGLGPGEVIDYVKYFDVRTDNSTIEIYMPSNPLLNHLRVKQSGITFSHLQNLPAKTVIGNPNSTTGVSSAIQIASIVANANPGDLITVSYIEELIQQQLTGTPGRIAKFGTVGVVNSLIREQTTQIFIEANTTMGQLSGEKLIMYSDAGQASIFFANVNGVGRFTIKGQSDRLGFQAGGLESFRINTDRTVTFNTPITVASTAAPIITNSAQLNINFNADLLDGQHGAYYLARANHTGTQLASTISNFATTVLGTVLTGLSVVTGSPITSADTILSALGKLQGQVNTNNSNLSGTTGRILKFISGTAAGNSIMSEASSTITVNGGVQLGTTTQEKILIFGSTADSYMYFADSAGVGRFSFNGKADRLSFQAGNVEAARINTDQTFTFIKPITISSTSAPIITNSTQLNINFNADLLDGQHGAYYLDRVNHTGTQLASTISNFSATVLATALAGLSIVTGSPITSSDTVLSAFGKLQGQVNTANGNISGTAGRIPQYVSGTAIGNSIMRQASGQIYVEGNSNFNGTAAEKIIIYGDATSSIIFFADVAGAGRYSIKGQSDRMSFQAGGVESFRVDGSRNVTFANPITIASTSAPIVTNSTQLNINFNADLLDGQHGAYYLDFNNLTNKPTTRNGYGITDVYTVADVNSLLAGKENTFAKGNITVGTGVSISGTLTGRLVTSGDVNFSLASGVVSPGTYRSVTVDTYGRVTGGTNPNSLAGYGLDTTVYTKAQVDALLGGSGDLSGSGTAGYFAIFTGPKTLGVNAMRDTGSEINIANTRAFGVEGAAAVRSYLHVHDYVGVGKSGQHGAIVVHSATTATAHPSTAIDIQSTTRGMGLPSMTRAQRQAMSPRDGVLVYQNDAAGPGVGVYWSLAGGWVKVALGPAD